MSIHSSPYVATFVFNYQFSSLPFALQVEEDGSIVKIDHEEKLDDYMKSFDDLPS
jgi:diaminopimelate decarboxylase